MGTGYKMMAISDGGSRWKARYSNRSKVVPQVLRQKAKAAEAYNNAVSTKKSYSFNPLPTAQVNRSGYPPSYTTQELKLTVLNPYLERQQYIASKSSRKLCLKDTGIDKVLDGIRAYNTLPDEKRDKIRQVVAPVSSLSLITVNPVVYMSVKASLDIAGSLFFAFAGRRN